MSGPSSPASTEEQRRLAGRYVLRQPVGRGGAGVVWKAEDELLGRAVAIKECMLPPTVDDADREKLLTRVMREARTAARLDHPALVTVFDVVQESGRPWIVMEYVESRSLSQVVRQDGPLPVAQVVEIGLTLLDALRVAHGAGVLHRDVKPANVLLTESGNVVLTDFGIAATTGDPTLTTSGMLLGSPSYMPPERARGEPATPDSDVWSLAATLYTLVEGTTPYSGDHPLAVLSAVAEHRRRPMELAGPLEPLLAEILDSEPDERPGELIVGRRLERIKADLAAQGPTTTGGTPIRSIGSYGEKSAAARTARLEAQRPAKDKRRREPEEPADAAAAVPEAPIESAPGDMAEDAASPAAVADEPSSRAAQPGSATADPKARLSLFGRRRKDDAAAGSAAAGGAAAGAAAAGAEAAEADRRGDQAWDFDDFFVPSGDTAQAPHPAPDEESSTEAAPSAAAAQEDVPPSDASGAEAPPVETPHAEAPQVEASPAEAPQAETDSPQAAIETPQPVPAEKAPRDRSAPPADTAAATPDVASSADDRATVPAPSREPAAPSSRPAYEPRDPRRRRIPLFLGLGALVVVAIIALALVLTGGSSKPKAVPGVPASSTGAGTSGGSSGGSGNTGSSPGASNGSTQSAGPNASTGAAPPAGWQTYHDPQFGWSVAMPPGFTRSADGNSRQVDFRDGQGRLLRVEINPKADPSAIGDWRTYEPAFARQVSNYQRIRMQPVDGGDGSRAADWEFTYSQGGSDLHVLNRGVVDGRTAHALYWQTPQSLWDSSTQLRDQIYSTFQPPPQ